VILPSPQIIIQVVQFNIFADKALVTADRLLDAGEPVAAVTPMRIGGFSRNASHNNRTHQRNDSFSKRHV